MRSSNELIEIGGNVEARIAAFHRLTKVRVHSQPCMRTAFAGGYLPCQASLQTSRSQVDDLVSEHRVHDDRLEAVGFRLFGGDEQAGQFLDRVRRRA